MKKNSNNNSSNNGLPKKKIVALVVLIICAIYIISPLDFIPDVTIIPGRIDDLAVLIPGIISLITLVKRNVDQVMIDEDEEDTED